MCELLYFKGSTSLAKLFCTTQECQRALIGEVASHPYSQHPGLTPFCGLTCGELK